MSGSEEAARSFYGKPAVDPQAAQPAADPFAGLVPAAEPAQAAPTAAAAAVAPAAEVPKPAVDPETQAESFYGGPRAPTRGMVDWNEPPAQPADYRLQAPPGVLDTSEAGQAAMLRLRDGFAEAGAGKTLAAELFNDAVRAEQGSGFPVSREAAETDLRQAFGLRYDAKIEAARGLVRRAAARCPEIISFLESSGLGNDPAFIKKVAAAAARRRG